MLLCLLLSIQLDTVKLPEITIYSNHLEYAHTLACLIHSEAGNQSEEGKVAVGSVVMNRVKYFDKTVEEVIYDPGQFSGVSSRAFKKQPDPETLNIAIRVLSGENNLPPSVLYFANTRIASNQRWLRHIGSSDIHPPFKIGDHTFYHDPIAWMFYDLFTSRFKKKEVIYP